MKTSYTPDQATLATAFVRLQNVLPHHGLSRLVGRLAASETSWLSQALIQTAQHAFDIDLSEAQRQNTEDYRSFNDFFTRELQDTARPLPEGNEWVLSPADGAMSQFGSIEGDALLQAKGSAYSLNALVGADPVAKQLMGGQFTTIYLAPSDYHRVHMPFDGKLLRWIEIPGALFSVNALTEAALPSLFCRNERLVCVFETDFGPAVVILVGALIVASIETVFGGDKAPLSPYRSLKTIEATHNQHFSRGEELGRFLMGSTVITCFPPNSVVLDKNLEVGMRTRQGQALGKLA